MSDPRNVLDEEPALFILDEALELSLSTEKPAALPEMGRVIWSDEAIENAAEITGHVRDFSLGAAARLEVQLVPVAPERQPGV